MQDVPGKARARAVPASRPARLGRLGAMAAGIAGNMAVQGARQLSRGERPDLRSLMLTPGNMRRLADDLARMRGAAMKMGQLMSMDSGDMIPPELADVLARLRAEADFMPPRQLRGVLDGAWGSGWRSGFARFDVRPMAAASIGQVHHARAHDGAELAIKVQYPGIARSIDSDVSNVGALIRVSGLLPRGFDLAPYLAEARRQLHEEADYEREAQCLTTFGHLLDGEPGLRVPRARPDLTTGTILAMEYRPGVAVESLVDAPQHTRDSVMSRLVALMLRELFEFALMQTDPNFANYRYDADADEIILLDFGATRSFAPQLVAQYRELMGAGLAGDRAGLEAAAQAIGFVLPETPSGHRRQIMDMVDMVFATLRASDVLDFGAGTLTAQLQEAGIALSQDGFVPHPLPMDALYLQRKFAGMFLLGQRLQARVPVRTMLSAHLEPALQGRQRLA